MYVKIIDASTKKLRIKTFATCLGLKDNVKKTLTFRHIQWDP